MYLYLMFIVLSLSNVYLVWVLMEMIFLFFFLFILIREDKSIGLIIYYFFQSVMSMMLFLSIFFFLDSIVFFVLLAKLGLFPFFYWVVLVSVKIGILGNIFVLGLQKISIFWMFWLTMNTSLSLLYFMVYLSVFFVIINLVMISDSWLLIVYSSIANTGMLLLSVLGSNYIFVISLYLCIIMSIVYSIYKLDSYFDLTLLVFFFLVIPPFILFFMKFYIILSLSMIVKLGFFLVIFDVFVLLYYFSLVFMKFMLMEMSVLMYMMNLLILLFLLLLSNCVTMIIFYKS